MVLLEQITGEDLSLRVRTRAAHCSAVKDRRQQGVYRVTPLTRGYRDHHGKAKRRVQFGLTSLGNVYILCSDWHTGAACEANDRGLVCCHVVASYWNFLKLAERNNK